VRIKLETIPEQDRSDSDGACWLCGRRFVIGSVACLAYSDDGKLEVGPTCPACLEEGPEGMQEHLDLEALWTRLVADQAEEMAAEGLTEAPTVEELLEMERSVAPWP
jgi:hypothetical protein